MGHKLVDLETALAESHKVGSVRRLALTDIKCSDQECASHLAVAEDALELALPESFRSIACQYALERIGLCGVWFMFRMGMAYADSLVVLNSDQFPWWTGATRPKNLVAVALSDPFSFVLDVTSGEISVTDPMTYPDAGPFVIASDFDLLLRGLGSIEHHKGSINDRQDFADAMHSVCGARDNNEFWREWVDCWGRDD